MNLIDTYAKIKGIKTALKKEDYSNAYVLIEKMEDKLKEQINIETAKAKGGMTEKERYLMAKKIIKGVEETCPAFKGAWFENGLQCICNSFYGVVLNDKIEGLPEVPEDVKKFKMENAFKTSKDFPIDFKFDFKEIKQTLKIAKSLLKEAKMNKSSIVDIDEGVYELANKNVNIENLYNVLVLIGDVTEVDSDDSNVVSPIYLYSKKGKAILLPLRK